MKLHRDRGKFSIVARLSNDVGVSFLLSFFSCSAGIHDPPIAPGKLKTKT
jgi:hypothetical protein